MSELDVHLIGVTKKFNETLAVDITDMEIRRGEFLSLIGPSGCGKTTTMRLIAGLEQPDSGQIYVRGRRMDGVPPYERNVGLVFQSFALFPHLNVLQNVEFGLRMHGVSSQRREEKAMQALRSVGMTNLAHRQISQLSGGQKQRVALARALVVEPAVILLDEPLGALDARLRMEMQSELKALQRQMGITFIHVSHNQSEALAMADRIAVMNEGRIEQIGSPFLVYREPRTRFVAEFVGRNNILQGEVVESSNGTVRIRTPHGLFAVGAQDRAVSNGQQVTFVVRADLMRSAAGGDGNTENQITGVIQGMEYAGSMVLLVMSLKSGGELKFEQHESLTENLAPRHGADYTVTWAASDAFLLP